MTDTIERLVEAANDRLRKSRAGVTLELRGVKQMIYLRGTFPPRLGSHKTKPYQQKIALKLKATPESIKKAEATAKLVGAELNLGRFDWGKWSDADQLDSDSVGRWIEKFEEDYWIRKERNGATLTTWNSDYHTLFKWLDGDRDLTIEYLANHLAAKYKADSHGRRKGSIAFGALAKFAGLDPTPLRRLRGNYGPTEVGERELPSDAEIVQWREWVLKEQPGWRWIYGMLAAYGLRPHEVFHVIGWEDFPFLRIENDSKTGSRPVAPLLPEWAKEWRLDEKVMPKKMVIEGVESNMKLGGKISRFFYKAPIPFEAYDLRHSWARRSVGKLPDSVAAKLMGHSLKRHLETYRRWIGDETYLEAYKQAVKWD